MFLLMLFCREDFDCLCERITDLCSVTEAWNSLGCADERLLFAARTGHLHPAALSRCRLPRRTRLIKETNLLQPSQTINYSLNKCGGDVESLLSDMVKQ